jgi:putative ABC transport system permease protein
MSSVNGERRNHQPDTRAPAVPAGPMDRTAAPQAIDHDAVAEPPRQSGVLALIRRALRGRRARFVLTLVGIAATTLLVLVLVAAHRSLSTGVNAYAGQPQIDLWIAPPGTDNLIRSSGFLRPESEVGIGSVPGVAAVDPVLRSFVSVQVTPQTDEARVDRLTLLAVAYAAPAGLGGPPELATGRAPAGAGEIALDRAAAHRLRVRPGDVVLVNQRAAEVVGLTRGTNLLATQFLFSDIEEARHVDALPGRASFLLVRLVPGSDAASVAEEIRLRFPDVAVFDRATFVANNLREVASGLLPLLVLIALLGVGVSSVLVVLLVQGLAEDRRADIAVLLALGASVPAIGAGLIVRAGVLVFLGGCVGTLLAVALAGFLDRFLPGIELSYTPGMVVSVLTIFLVAGLMAAVIPLLRLRRIDPLEAFRA